MTPTQAYTESIHDESKATPAAVFALAKSATTIRSISDIRKNQRLKDNNKESVDPLEIISELRNDNVQLTRSFGVTDGRSRATRLTVIR